MLTVAEEQLFVQRASPVIATEALLFSRALQQNITKQY